MTDRKVMHQALDALENSSDFVSKDVSKSHLRGVAIDALRAAIAQPEQQTERNFCSRCGKRLVGDGIHTCSLPKAKQ